MNPKLTYNSPSLSTEEQIELLRKKGLYIPNEVEAKYWLTNISYFRFKRYSYPFKDYEKKDGNYVTKVFDHSAFLSTLDEECDNTDEPFLKSYTQLYEPKFPPSWMLMEIITFGTFSRMFENVKASEEKSKVCEHFKQSKAIFTSWLHSIAFIRNKCAHHAKIVYAPIKFEPAMPQKRSRQFLKEADLINSHSLYAVLCCILSMLQICSNQSEFSKKLRQLFNDFPEIEYDKLGFTPDWEKEDLWN